MKPLPRKTEDRSISALNRIIDDHPTMEGHINKGDKELSWDGFIRIYQSDDNASDIGADLFRRGLCLPSDNKMTCEQQEKVIEIVKRCFD